MKRGSTALLVLLLVSLVATACASGGNGSAANNGGSGTSSASGGADGGAGSKEQVEIRFMWWGTQDRHDITVKALELFEEKYPNITVTPEYSGYDGYFDKLNVMVAGGNAPDVFQNTYQFMIDYATRGVLADLNTLPINLDDVDDTTKNIGAHDGKLMMLPAGVNSSAFAFDPALFEKAGISTADRFTWESFAEAAKTFAQKMGDGYYGTPDYMADVDLITYFMRQRGKVMYDGNKLGFEAQDLTDWFTYWDELRRAKAIPSAEVTASIGSGELEKLPIVTGHAPVTKLGSNQLGSMETLSGRALDMMFWPAKEGGTEGHYISAGLNWSVYSKSAHPEEAALLIDFLTNDLGAAEILGANRGVPISSKVREAIQGSLSEVDQKQFAFIDKMSKIATPFNPNQPAGANEVNKLMGNISQEIQFEIKSIPDAVKEFMTKANEILQKN